MKRIAIFHNYMDNIGGAEIVGLTLARELKADIYTTNINAGMIKKMGFSDVLPRMHSIGKVPVNAPLKQQLASLRFRFFKPQKKYDYFIIDGDWAMSGALKNKPSVWYVHSPIREIWDLYPYTRKKNVPYFARWIFDLWVHYNRYLNKKYVKHVSTLVCNSHNTRERVKKYLKKEATVIYPPIDTSHYSCGKDKGYFLSVNRLISHKRVDVQMKAFAKMPNETLIVVGSYEQSKHFKAYADYIKKIKPPNVTIKSWVTYDELLKLYKHCKGFITTSKDEDFGMTPVEAMASGKPVIATNEGGYKETVIDGKTGVLIDDITVSKLISAVKTISKDPEKYTKACLKQAKAFDTKTFIKSIVSELDSLKPSTLYLTTTPHHVHSTFASSIEHRRLVAPFESFFTLVKKCKTIELFFPILAFFYGLSLKVPEDVVLVEGSGMLYVALFMKLRKPSLKVIYLDADLGIQDIITKKKKPFLFGFVLSSIDGVMSVSTHNKDAILKLIKKPVQLFMPYPKKINSSLSVKRKNYGLYVGRLDSEKNIEGLLRFARNTKAIDKLIIVGDGVLRKKVIREASFNNKIVYVGTKKDISTYYLECTFFLHLAEYDSYPCTLLEACQAGCFPLLSKKVGNSHLFDDHFLLDNVNDILEIEKKIKNVMKNRTIMRKRLYKIALAIKNKEETIMYFKKNYFKLLKEVFYETPL